MVSRVWLSVAMLLQLHVLDECGEGVPALPVRANRVHHCIVVLLVAPADAGKVRAAGGGGEGEIITASEVRR